MGTLSVINGPIIGAGESLSEGISCMGGDAVRITFPTEWTPAHLTFQISTDGGGYNDLYDVNGNEIMLTVTPGAAVHVSGVWSTFWNFIKFRSGTSKSPVTQKEQRDFAITLRHDAASPRTSSGNPKPTTWAAGHNPTQ